MLLVAAVLLIGTGAAVFVAYRALSAQPHMAAAGHRSPIYAVVTLAPRPGASAVPTAEVTLTPSQPPLADQTTFMPQDTPAASSEVTNANQPQPLAKAGIAPVPAQERQPAVISGKPLPGEPGQPAAKAQPQSSAPSNAQPSLTATPPAQALGAAALTATATPSPTASATATAAPTNTTSPSPTASASPTPTLAPGQIRGRLLLNNGPAAGVRLRLEDAAGQQVAETGVDGEGRYHFDRLPASSDGYLLVFSQAWNDHFDVQQVISWGWLGPVPVQDGDQISLPDLELSLQGFGPTTPAPNSTFSAGQLPLTFEWAGYPGATTYWVDLVQDQGQQPIWSQPVQATTLAFDGMLGNGQQIQSGEYWWGVGAQRQLGAYSLVVYGYLPVVRIEP